MAFVDAINARAPDALAKLMSDDHKFIDAHGNEVIGREKMLAGWRGYFQWFPDYQIEVVQSFEDGDESGLFGYAVGSFKGNHELSWRLPAARKTRSETNVSRCGKSTPTRKIRLRLSSAEDDSPRTKTN